MILHYLPNNLYGKEFIELIKSSSSNYEHFFFLYGGWSNQAEIYQENNVKIEKNRGFLNYLHLAFVMVRAKKVIIHGMYDFRSIILLFLLDKSKVFWVIWGGDLYLNFDKSLRFKLRIANKIKQKLFIKLKYLITTNDELHYFRQHYNHNAIAFDAKYNNKIDFCFPTRHTNQRKGIMIGHSGGINVEHAKAFDKISEYLKSNKYKVYVPVTYGDKDYIKELEKQYSPIYGERIEFIKQHLELSEYKRFLRQSIDIGVFPTSRQAGFSNILQILAYGKKVYISKDSPLFNEFINMGLKIYEFEDIEYQFGKVDSSQLTNNVNILIRMYGLEQSYSRWEEIFKYNIN